MDISVLSYQVTAKDIDFCQIVMGVLFSSALVAAIVRTCIRIKLRRRLYLDDAFLGLACFALTAATTVLYEELETLYLAEDFMQYYVSGDMADMPVDVKVATISLKYQRTDFVHWMLSWIVIFSVKFTFLAFFYRLLDRLPRFLLYWKMVVVANVAALLYCISYAFLECPYSGLKASE